MRTYVIRRLLLFIPTILLAAGLTFLLMRMVPGDLATLLAEQINEQGAYTQQTNELMEKLRTELGLDQPLHVQFWIWLQDVAQGDLGLSMWTGKPVNDIVMQRLPVSLWLAFLIIVVSFAWSIPVGVLAAKYQNTWFDQVARVLSMGGLSIPNFWLGLLAIYILSRYFHWLPPFQYQSILENPGQNFAHLIWPVLVWGYASGGGKVRFIRSQMLEILRQDYIRTARAKGLGEQVTMYRHALRNGFIPVLNYSGVWASGILGGLVIVEYIFLIPGMGSVLVNSITRRDYTTVQGIVFVLALIVLTVNLVIDLLNGWIDPRIRVGRQRA